MLPTFQIDKGGNTAKISSNQLRIMMQKFLRVSQHPHAFNQEHWTALSTLLDVQQW